MKKLNEEDATRLRQEIIKKFDALYNEPEPPPALIGILSSTAELDDATAVLSLAYCAAARAVEADVEIDLVVYIIQFAYTMCAKAKALEELPS